MKPEAVLAIEHMKTTIDQIQKKLRETEFFLAKMTDQEARAFGDKEPFDFYLSAFLSAGMSVRDGLFKGQIPDPNRTITEWRSRWKKTRTEGELCLFDFMGKDRDVEVHGSGSRRKPKEEPFTVFGNSYSDKSGTLTIFAAPATGPTFVCKSAYYFIIGGTDRNVIEATNEYLVLLNHMVAEFCRACE